MESMSCENQFREQLRQHGLRLTPQREAVLSVLHAVGRAAAPEEIFARVSVVDAAVDRSTIYRTLDLLDKFKMVTVIDSGEKQRLYELSDREIPHMHLLCRGCGKIMGVDLDLLQPFLTHLDETVKFQIDLANITLQGICGDCQTATTAKNFIVV
jgi:Fur family ferric uptake transcriptional regulator